MRDVANQTVATAPFSDAGIRVPSPVLITGTGGMIGSHLFQALQRSGVTVIGSFYRPTIRLSEIAENGELVELDVRYFEPVRRLIDARRPRTIFHLAAQSLPTTSWTQPWETMEINIGGTVNLFEAIKAVRAHDGGYDPVVVVACSSAQYGASMKPENVPITEDAPMLPLHPYGVSKVGQDLLTFQYWQSDRIRGVRGRIFNTTGPRKQDDVISDFARRIARIYDQGGKLRVGNIRSRRAVLDVIDTVDALARLSVLGEPGEAYNICGDTAYEISEFIAIFEQLIDRRLETFADPTLLRPTDEAIIFGDNTRLKQCAGWRQSRSIRDTLRSVLDYEMNQRNERADKQH